MSQKSERLVNLTIVLLASRRFLSKAEIFTKVLGYEGNAEARDRMFERDKEELRKIGIAIEVGPIDAFFDDDLGYRIKRDSYALQIKDLTPADLALLSLARDAYDKHAASDAAMSGILKLKASGIEVDSDVLPSIYSKKTILPPQLANIIEAIARTSEIRFEYLDENLEAQLRTVYPYRIAHKKNRWFLTGYDLDRDDLRTFRLDRFDSDVTVDRKSGVFEIDYESLALLDSIKSEPYKARLKLRRGRASTLRQFAKVEEAGDEWDLVSLDYWDASLTKNQILWEGSDAIVLEPADLRQEVLDALAKVVKLHA